MDRMDRARQTFVLAAAVSSAMFCGSALAKAEKITVKYEVKSGDTLSTISDRFGVTIDEIVGWNEKLEKQEEIAKVDAEAISKASVQLQAGMVLKIPGKPSGKSGVIKYKVEKGDSLWSIGKQFHVKPAVIVKWNSPKLEVPESSKTQPLDEEAEASKKLAPGMVLWLPGKPSGDNKSIKYKVVPGDTLWSIGKQFHVKPTVVIKWNKDKLGTVPKAPKTKKKVKQDKGKAGKYDEVMDLVLIQPGMTLVIHAIKPDLGERVAAYRAESGDTPKKVALAYGVELKTFMAANFLLPKDKLMVGQVLDVPLPVTDKNTRSIGSPQGGKLLAGEQMPQGPGYLIRKPSIAWATSETITQLVTCIAKVQRSYAGTHDMVVGHLSKQGGGKLFPHKSHQSGRDVDVGYYLDGMKPGEFKKVTKDNLDRERTGAFVQCLVDETTIQYIFIDNYIQKMLHAHFEAKSKAEDFLTKVFQWPRGDDKQLGIVRHEAGHDDHIHIRFMCPPDDEGCHD